MNFNDKGVNFLNDKVVNYLWQMIKVSIILMTKVLITCQPQNLSPSVCPFVHQSRSANADQKVI